MHFYGIPYQNVDDISWDSACMLMGKLPNTYNLDAEQPTECCENSVIVRNSGACGAECLPATKASVKYLCHFMKILIRMLMIFDEHVEGYDARHMKC